MVYGLPFKKWHYQHCSSDITKAWNAPWEAELGFPIPTLRRSREEAVRQAIPPPPPPPFPMWACKVKCQHAGIQASKLRSLGSGTVLLPWASLVWGLGPCCLFITLIYISNKESHKATADERRCGSCDHHHDDTPSHVDEEAQATTNQDLSQLHHAGESSTVHTFASPTAARASRLLHLQGKHRNDN